MKGGMKDQTTKRTPRERSGNRRGRGMPAGYFGAGIRVTFT
jgi:hypothetical protein